MLLLKNKKVKGILLELGETDSRTKKMIDFLTYRGFVLKYKRQSDLMKNGNFSSIYNYIFERK